MHYFKIEEYDKKEIALRNPITNEKNKKYVEKITKSIY